MSDALQLVERLGPLAPLCGTWEGGAGDDLAPGPDRGPAHTPYRERLSFVPFGPVTNHEQTLYGLRYTTTAWRLGEEGGFHEDCGYWLYDPGEGLVMRCFVVPRGITVLAGGRAAPGDRHLRLAAELGSPTFGICSNPFLERQFKTVRYTMEVVLHDDGALSYEQDTELVLPGRPEPFHHVDRNHLRRVAE